MRCFKPVSFALLCVLSGACLCMLLASTGWGQERTRETFREVADRMVKAINAADYEGIRKDFNKEMLEAFPVEKCRTFFSKEISGKFGKIDKLQPPEFKSAAEAAFIARCERGTLNITLVVDDQGRVAGMLFRPVPTETFREVADRMVKAINAADYEGIRKDFNKEMLEAFPVEKCRTFFSTEISGKFGKINRLEPPGFKSAAEAIFMARCERGALDFTLVVDDQGRVSGMQFRPVPTETFREVADRMVKAINAADYEGIRKDFNKEMLEAFPVEKCRTFFSKEISGKFGKINRLEPPEFKSAADAVFVARCERGALDITLTLDDQGRVAGMLFRPSSDKKRRQSNSSAGASLTGLISDLRKENKLVGLGAMVMVDGQVVASAVGGERQKGSGVAIELGDRWHLGSVTKSITATMIARLVESGQMNWTDTIGERFSDALIHEDWKPVTLQQLLTHTSGAPANFSLSVSLKKPALGPECTQKRREAVMQVIARKPAHPPGEKFAYSNVGYTIAGAMAESATGVSWEDLVKCEVFEPLKLTDAGFGPPKSPSKTLDQPRGHQVVLGLKFSADDDDDDNTPIMGPAGAVHMTLGNLCTYATEHLRGELGTGKLLAAETYKQLHAPRLDDYACGWVVKQPTYEIPHTTYWHNGSNTMWYALVVFIPGKNMVVAVTSNDGDIAQAESAAWEVVESSANQFNVEGDAARRKSLAPEE